MDISSEGGARALEALIEALGDGDVHVRGYAARMLGDVGDERAMEPLIVALGETREMMTRFTPNHGVAIASIVDALVRIDDERAVEPLIQALGDGDAYVIGVDVAGVLVKIGEPAVEPLIEALCHGNISVRKSAIELLRELGDERAVEPLIQALGDGDAYVRVDVAGVLGEIGDERAVEPLIQALGDGDAYVRGGVAGVLGEIGDERAVEPLIEALGDEAENVRDQAIRALGKFGSERALGTLLEALVRISPYHSGAPGTFSSDDRYWINQAPIRALGSIGDERAVEPLIALLNSGYPSAAEALGSIGDERAVEPLINALGEGHKWLREAAAEALVEFGRGPHRSKIVASLIAAVRTRFAEGSRNCQHARRNSVRVLGDIGDPDSFDPLVEILENPPYGYQHDKSSAALALGKLGDKRAVEPLIRALGRDDFQFIRSSAIESLGRLGDERAVIPINSALYSGYKGVSRSANLALGMIGSELAISYLMTAALSQQNSTRDASFVALVRIRDQRIFDFLIRNIVPWFSFDNNAIELITEFSDPRAVKPLIELFREGHERLNRYKFVRALVEIGEPSVEPLIEALDDRIIHVRSAASSALGKLGDERAVEPLIVALGEITEMIKRLTRPTRPSWQGFEVTEREEDIASIAAALGEIGDERAVEPLIVTLGEITEMRERLTRPDFRPIARSSWQRSRGSRSDRAIASIAAALGEIGDERAVEPLTRALSVDDRYVRIALLALGHYNPTPERPAEIRDDDWDESDEYMEPVWDDEVY